jgi:hypothetical protein
MAAWSRVAFLSLCTSLALLQAQSTTSLRGTITDPQGAALVGAVVTLTSPANSLSRQGVSNDSGEYQFLQIPPGAYQIKAEKPGFSVLTRSGLTLLVNTPATLDLKMELGQASEMVNVSAEATALNTVDASVGNAFNETQVRQLPLQTRNVVELLSLQPGVTPTGEVLGARRDQNNVTLDGVDVNDNQNSGITNQASTGSNANATVGGTGNTPGFNSVLPVPLDSVQEFRVTVGGQGANQGRSAGGQVTLVTKSGSNEFHGSLYEFHRNTVTAANTWFNNRRGVAREQLIRNQFGASVGGPIKKDRLFFFFNYEQRIDASARSQARAVPSEALKQGILTFRLTNGQAMTLNPAELKSLDPLGVGISQGMINLFKNYPVGNDPAIGLDSGLNFSGLRFNAPLRWDDKAYVGKMDYRIDSAGKHLISVRGTLADISRDQVLAQFPGQAPAAKLLDNSRGISAQYTGVLTSNIVNSFIFGFTRMGLEQSGTPGISFLPSSIDTLQNFTRGTGRRMPVLNILDDLTWTRGKHTIGTGINFRFVRNDRFSFTPSFASYGFSRGTLLGLGNDITSSITDFIRAKTGDSTLALANGPAVTAGVGNLLGLVSYGNITYQYQRDGSPLGQGLPQTRNFATNEYEFYVQDQWRARRDLTLTFGLRYGNYTAPWERNGLQVGPTIGIDQYFAERVGGQDAGIPGNVLPNQRLQYDLIGPVNGKESWYKRDNNNFAPRFSFAYSPNKDAGLLNKIFGKNGVLRGGAAMVYDRFGSQMITDFDAVGSVGVATRLGFPASYRWNNAPRFDAGIPAFPAAPPGGFPNTPPDVTAVAGTFLGISPDLVNPYSMLLNLNFARDIKGGLTIEAGYVGRLSRKLLLQADTYTPLTKFKDPASGQTWEQMAGITRSLADGGLTANAVRNNPGAFARLPFVENMFPGLANSYFPGSASANYFWHVYGENDGSDLDGLHILDRVDCISKPGCFTFYSRQGSANPTWFNAGMANFHGGTLSIRKPLSKGFAFDFNYTLSHSIDNGSAAESGSGQFGGTLQSAFDPGAFRGSSDFDIRHNVNLNGLYELPFGKGKKFMNGAPGWVNQLVGGWQISGIMRARSGLPSIIGGSGLWNTNYWLSSLADPKPGVTSPVMSTGFNQNGNPSMFGNTSAVSAYTDQYPGKTGTRAIVRLAGFVNFDLSAAKSFRMPWKDTHKLQLRGEAFNAFNHVNFFNPSLALSAPATFGEYRDTTPPRVMQFALRYEF